MKNLAILGLFLALMFSVGTTAQKTGKQPTLKPLATSGKEVPFYFPMKIIEGVTDPVRQHAEYGRYLRATEHCFQGTFDDMDRSYVVNPDSIRITTNLVSTASPAHSGKKSVLVLDNFVRVDGVVRYTNLCEQRTITDHELDVVVQDLVNNVVLEAAKLDFEKWKRLPDLALKARAVALKTTVPELLQWIDLKDPHWNITYREMQYLPEALKLSDFIPYEFHLGLNTRIQGILGVTWLNAGLVYYNPQARFFDYLVGKPVVAAHEFVHANSKLQRLPLTEAFDVEMFACFPAMLYPENQISMWFHGYTKDWRELSRVYFGLSFEEAKKRIIKYNLEGPVDVDEKAYREFAAMADKIKAELMVFMEEKAIPEFYSDPQWWGALHDILNIKNAVIKVMMAITYDPVLLGGREKTMAWIAPRHEEFMKDAEEILAELKDGSDSGSPGEEMVDFPRVPQHLQELYERMFTPDERAAMERYVGVHPEILERLKQWDIGAALEVYRSMSKKPVKGGVR